jgi:hypothetical protein
MDTITATKATGELRKQINSLYRRKGQIEGDLQREHVTQERAAAKRTLLIAGFARGGRRLEGVHARRG